MDQIMQRNANMVGDNTAASHLLTQETEELFRLVTHFKAGDRRPAAPSLEPACVGNGMTEARSSA